VMLSVSTRAHAFLESIPQVEIYFTTSLMMGDRTVEIPWRYSRLERPTRLEPIVLPDHRIPADYATASCKHESAVLKQSRHMRHAHEVWKEGTLIQRALMLSREGQCGIDTAKTNATDVIPVATMDRPDGYSHMYLSEFTLYSASVLNFYGSTHYFAALKSVGPPYSCPTFNAMLVDPLHPEPLLKQIFTWRSHLGRCGGDGRCMQAHEIVKLSLKRLTLSNSNPGGVAFPSNQLLIEPRHLRSDDLYAIAEGLHAKYAAMDLMITSSLSKSTLLHTSKSSDYSLRLAVYTKLTKNLRSTYPLQL